MSRLSLSPIPNVRRKESQIITSLTELAAKVGPGNKLPTMSELCAGLNVARATLDRALAAVEANGILLRRRGSGIYVTRRVAQKSIGVVFYRHFLSSFAPVMDRTFLAACRARALSHQQRTVLYVYESEGKMDIAGIPGRETLLADIQAGNVHALIASGFSRFENPEADLLSIPVATIMPGGNKPAEDAQHGIPEVVIQNFSSLIQQGVQSLVRQGCRRIALISHFSFLRPEGFQTDLKAYRSALKTCNLPHRSEWEWWDRRQLADYSELTHDEIGYAAFNELMRRYTGGAVPGDVVPDGMVITDDNVTRGALVAARRAGIRIGADVRIASHSNTNSSVLRNNDDVITRMEFDPAQEAEGIFEILDARLTGSEHPPRRIVLSPRLLEPFQMTTEPQPPTPT
jgi:DNA-binding LacI/PurR family transcriptional regulator